MYQNIDFYLSIYRDVWFTVAAEGDLFLLTVWQIDKTLWQMDKIGKIIVQFTKPTVDECLQEFNRVVALGDLF